MLIQQQEEGDTNRTQTNKSLIHLRHLCPVLVEQLGLVTARQEHGVVSEILGLVSAIVRS